MYYNTLSAQGFDNMNMNIKAARSRQFGRTINPKGIDAIKSECGGRDNLKDQYLSLDKSNEPIEVSIGSSQGISPLS